MFVGWIRQPLGDCIVIGAKITFDIKERITLCCFAVYTIDTGSAKKSYELDLLKEQGKKKQFFFNSAGCERRQILRGESDLDLALFLL